jgi:hypothetical protein
LELGDSPRVNLSFNHALLIARHGSRIASFSGRAAFTDGHAAGLENLRNLESVSLSGSAITDAGLAHLSPKNPLKSLDVSYTSIGDAGAAHLARITSLETLDLSHTWITDAGLRRLASLPNLKSLTLRRVMVSDAGLRELARCESLETLVLNDLAITPAGVAELDRLPRLRSLEIDGIKVFTRTRRCDGTARCVLGDRSAATAVPAQRSAIPQVAPGARGRPEPNAILRPPICESGREADLFAQRRRRRDAHRRRRGADHRSGRHELTRRSAHAPGARGDPNRVDGSGRTALTVAAGCGHREMMELLLEYGAEFHVSGAQSPLCSAAACGRLEALEYLVTRGADVNCPNHHGNPPLHISLRNPKSFDALLELGADVNAADAHGQTPLHLAAEMQDVELMTRLLKLGADPGRKNAAGETPIAIAARLGPQAIVELLRSTRQHARETLARFWRAIPRVRTRCKPMRCSPSGYVGVS